ncbi:zf-TFIIB domain-containing protein [Propionivibrio sp.]|uniref:zf-TFIIB domain-containing protein n=1 Tax=Propionivibrio sp. TaxID=2212460 RepID=UPI00261B8390|nr:zf-TFIIB domain-containing protein [Propionivibrio sp.]
MSFTPPTDISACPSCAQQMTRLDLAQRNFGTLTLDLCFPCQGIWFDAFESEQIAPSGIIDLFKLIHTHRDDPRRQHAATLHCPRCKRTLMAQLDLVRSGHFTYHRCPHDHGRFTAFAQFMIEKGFVRQLAPAEIMALAARIGTIHCTGCGAPVDIRTEAACSHCAAPISILDPDAVEKALADYQNKEYTHTRRDPEALADALLAIEKQRQQQKIVPEKGTLIGDLFLSGVGIVFDFFP